MGVQVAGKAGVARVEAWVEASGGSAGWAASEADSVEEDLAEARGEVVRGVATVEAAMAEAVMAVEPVAARVDRKEAWRVASTVAPRAVSSVVLQAACLAAPMVDSSVVNLAAPRAAVAAMAAVMVAA